MNIRLLNIKTHKKDALNPGFKMTGYFFLNSRPDYTKYIIPWLAQRMIRRSLIFFLYDPRTSSQVSGVGSDPSFRFELSEPSLGSPKTHHHTLGKGI